jgi:hypothetical protein
VLVGHIDHKTDPFVHRYVVGMDRHEEHNTTCHHKLCAQHFR